MVVINDRIIGEGYPCYIVSEMSTDRISATQEINNVIGS